MKRERKRPARLVENKISHDTIEALTELLECAKSGENLGIVFGVMYRNRDINVGNTGEFDRNPLFARGVVAELDDYLSAQTEIWATKQ